MHEAYEQYFRVRHYDRRYPAPNRLTLEWVRSRAGRGTTVLDIGAGNGRYAIPLAGEGYRVIAVEPSDAAREQLAERADAAGVAKGIRCAKTFADVDDTAIESSAIALFMFGVL